MTNKDAEREREREQLDDKEDVVSINDKYLKSIEKLAEGYEYEEVQTLLEDTPTGTKKKVIRSKKHMPPNFQALQYLMKRNSKPSVVPVEEPIEIPSEKVHEFKVEKF